MGSASANLGVEDAEDITRVRSTDVEMGAGKHESASLTVRASLTMGEPAKWCVKGSTKN